MQVSRLIQFADGDEKWEKINIPLASERPQTPVSARDIMRIQIIQIPAQTAEDILAAFKEDVKFASTLLIDPIDVALHVKWGVSRAEDRNLGLQKLREGFCPLVRAGRVAQAWVEEHEAVQIRIKGLEILRLVHGVEVVDVASDLHLAAQAVLHETAERILGGSLGQRELCVSVGHAFGADEDDVQEGAGEHVRELQPDFAGQRGLSAGAENEDPDRGCLQTQSFHVDVFAGLGRVKGVSEGYTPTTRLAADQHHQKQRRKTAIVSNIPLKLFKPSAVSRPLPRTL